VRHIIDTFAEGNVNRFKSVKLRLSAPVIIGEKVQTEMWIDDTSSSPATSQYSSSSNGVTRIVYRQLVIADELAGSKDRVVISNAVVELWDEEAGVRSKI